LLGVASGLSWRLLPRATLSLLRVSRSRAAAHGRAYVVPDDVKALAAPVVAHRILLTPESQMRGTDAVGVITDILRSVPVPAGRAAG